MDWTHPGVRTSLGLLPTVLVSHALSNVNDVVDRLVASTLTTGAIAALGFGHRLVTLPHGLLSHALLQVLYPSLSARLATEGPGAAGLLLRRGMVTLTLLLPVATLLAVESATIVQLVYGRGRFGPEDVAVTAAALRAFAPGLVFAGVRDLALRGLYAVNDRRLPIIAAVAGAATNVAGDFSLGPLLGVTGLALATSGSQAVSCAVALPGLGRGGGRVQVSGILRALAPVAVAGAVSGAVMVLLSASLPATATTAGSMLRVATVGAAGIVAHLVMLWLRRVPELREMRSLARRGRSRRRG
jgi:putative peptidoglycan lipid II flippase